MLVRENWGCQWNPNGTRMAHESNDRHDFQSQTGSVSINLILDDTPQLSPRFASENSKEEDASSTQSDASDSDSSHSLADPGEAEPPEISSILVQAEAVSRRCAVQEIVMQLPRSSLNLADMIDPNAWPAFQKWIQNGFNALSNSEGSRHAKFGSVRLWLPFGNFELKAKSVRVRDVDDDSLTIAFNGLKRSGNQRDTERSHRSNRSSQSRNSALASIAEASRI
jgi:hypothetical protein